MSDGLLLELDFIKSALKDINGEKGKELVLQVRGVMNDLEKAVALLSSSQDKLKRLHVYKLAEITNTSLNEILIGLSHLSPIYRDWKFLEEITQKEKGESQ